MRTTVNLSDDLVAEAMKETGISEKTRLLHKGLEALIEKSARERLVNLFGTMPDAKAPPRGRMP